MKRHKLSVLFIIIMFSFLLGCDFFSTLSTNSTLTTTSISDVSTTSSTTTSATSISTDTTPQSIIIHYNTNGGGNLNSTLAQSHTPITYLPTPDKTGYQFIGWFLDSELTSPFLINGTLTQETTLHAKWAIKQYYIHFHTNSSEVIASVAIDYNSDITLPTPQVVQYRTFNGWYTNDTLTTAFNYTKMPAMNLNVYAAWNYETFTINFNSNDGDSLAPIEIRKFTPGGELPAITKYGFYFDGWYYNPELTSPYDVESLIDSDLTLYAGWVIDHGQLHSLKFVVLEETLAKDIYVSSPHTTNTQLFMLSYNDLLFGFGTNYVGQLGNGKIQNVNNPEIINTLPLNQNEKITQIAPGANFTLVLTSDNRLFIWGDNTYNLVSNSYIGPYSHTPVNITSRIPLLQDELITLIESGTDSAYVLTSNGRVFSWGMNQYGELGNNDSSPKGDVQDISPNFNFTEGEYLVGLKAGNQFVIAYTNKTRVFTWGINHSGQLGNNTLNNSSVPIDITSYFQFVAHETITSIGAGFRQGYLATSRGRVFGWGDDPDRDIFDNQNPQKTPYLFPFDIFGDYVISISGGRFHVVMVTSKGRVFTSGTNSFGAVGDNYSYEITDLIPLLNNDKIIKVGASHSNTYFLTAMGYVYGIGIEGDYYLPDYQSNKPLINQVNDSFSLNPGEKILKIDKHHDGYHYVGLTSENRVFVWGSNTYHQLGYSQNKREATPIDITEFISTQFNDYVVDISCSSVLTALVTSKGYLIIFGYNMNYLGDNQTPIFTSRLSPTDVSTYFNLAQDEYITQVSLLGDRGYVKTNLNQVYAWGRNQFGYLGDGSSIDRPFPINITTHFSLLPNEQLLEFNRTESDVFILTSLNRLLTIGSGYNYISGDGTTTTKRIPFDVTPYLNLANGEQIIGVYTGYRHVLVLTSEHRVLAWGDNGNRYIDLKTNDSIKTPKDITSLLKLNEGEYVVSIAPGHFFTIALTNQNRVLSWGYNDYNTLAVKGQVSNMVYNIISEFKLSNQDFITNIYASGHSIFAISNQGNIYSWGNNIVGQLANGKSSLAYSPRIIHFYQEEVYEEESHYRFETYDTFEIINDDYHVVSWYKDKGFSSIVSDTIMPDYSLTLYGKKMIPTAITYYVPTQLDVVYVSDIYNKEFFFIVTSDNRVFTWGNNSYGMLGTGKTTDEVYPVDITHFFHFEVGETLVKIIIGSEHVVALSNYGSLYVWGNNTKSQLGFTKTAPSRLYDDSTGQWVFNYPNYRIPNNITHEISLESNEVIVHVDIIGNSTICFTSAQRIFIWGEVETTPGTYTVIPTPIEGTNLISLEEGETIVDIIQGYDFKILLTSNGRIFTYGKNTYGQLGNNSTTQELLPVEITNQFNLDEGDYIVKISANSYSGIAVTNNNRVFMWGDNRYYTLGYSSISSSLIPLEITGKFNFETRDTVIDIASGMSHTLLLTNTGRIYTWGNNLKDSLGIGHSNPTSEIHELTNFFTVNGDFITSVAAAYYYSVAVTELGSLYHWGSGQASYSVIENNTNIPTEIVVKNFMPYITIDYSPDEAIELLQMDSESGFTGWYDDVNYNKPHIINSHILPTYNLYSKFELIVKFETFGGDILEDVSVLFGQNVKNFTIPTKAGNFFGGWYEDSELSVKAKFINKSTTLYVKWIEGTEADLIGSSDLWISYTSEGYSVDYYEGTQSEVIIPRIYYHTLHGYDYVTTVGSYAFYDTEVTSVQLPNSIDIIKECAFYDSSIKKLIFLGDAPTQVDDHGFYGYSSAIFITEEALNWPSAFFYYKNVRLISDEIEPMDVAFFPQIELWNQASFEYATLMYSNPMIDWTSMMITTDPVQKTELIAFSNSLVQGLTTTEDKVYAIYQWVSQNINYSYDSVNFSLWEAYETKTGVCHQYAELMNELLRAQNIPSLYVGGYYFGSYRDFESLTEPKEVTESSRHGWNYVYVNDSWLILDATHKRYDISMSSYNLTLFALSVENMGYHLDGMDMTLENQLYYVNGEIHYYQYGYKRFFPSYNLPEQSGVIHSYHVTPEIISFYIDTYEGTGYVMNGWIEYDGYHYYARFDGKLYCDVTVEIDGVTYSFDSDCRLIIENESIIN